MINPVNAACPEALDYRTYRPHKRSLRYNGKMATGMAKMAKRVESIMKPYRFNASNPVTVLSYLRQYKRACDSNEVLERVAMWALPFFMAKPPAVFLIIRLTPIIGVQALVIVGQEFVGQERIYTHFEVDNSFCLRMRPMMRSQRLPRK